ILWTPTGSEQFGNGLSDVLFGSVSPSGRLNMTWYASDDDLPEITDYRVKSAGRTYMHFKGEPTFEFGYGLSYTTFELENIKREDVQGVNALKNGYNSPECIENRKKYYETCEDKMIKVTADVINTGDTESDVVIKAYANGKLAGFTKEKALTAGERREIQILIDIDDVRSYDEASKKMVADPSPEIKLEI
ncbi:MAG: glycoside hydrolase family 3 C-terminal domain-containing protein, partial [Lachnospiraceae bacterium]|nr:glycoside hydrolase family 3 C-terminal domain-containing protein [Lachnospiraceae bacterium]